MYKLKTLNELREALDEVEQVLQEGTARYNCFCQHDAKEALVISFELLRRLAEISALIHGDDSEPIDEHFKS